MDWKSYEMETGLKGKDTRLNSASVRCYARRIMAKEWARALGRSSIDPEASALEKWALHWKERGKKGGQDGGR